ncbi:hypothetical protein [Echinicola rosea]|uniref:FecR protein domain-containing protein n=1 Tax=Echinicola rosea TaxID=1807691 RepID=A0ABQ1V4X0_9BACT|nr:hypothetical protein [Echinicola rosea]GGF36804.1 hypothetical protein GCM10011339_26630 [Echinicola rosea]
MNITNDLLDRYSRNLCSPGERALVEAWLDSTHDETFHLTELELQSMDSEVWDKLNQGMHSKKDVPMYRTFLRYAAGVALAAGLVSASFWSGYSMRPKALTGTAVKDSHTASTIDNMLYLSNNPGISKRVSANSCELRFQGVLRVYNNSPSPKLVTCGGKTLSASPGKATYYLNTKLHGFREINMQSGEMLFYENQLKKSSISICV